MKSAYDPTAKGQVEHTEADIEFSATGPLEEVFADYLSDPNVSCDFLRLHIAKEKIREAEEEKRQAAEMRKAKKLEQKALNILKAEQEKKEKASQEEQEKVRKTEEEKHKAELRKAKNERQKANKALKLEKEKQEKDLLAKAAEERKMRAEEERKHKEAEKLKNRDLKAKLQNKKINGTTSRLAKMEAELVDLTIGSQVVKGQLKNVIAKSEENKKMLAAKEEALRQAKKEYEENKKLLAAGKEKLSQHIKEHEALSQAMLLNPQIIEFFELTQKNNALKKKLLSLDYEDFVDLSLMGIPCRRKADHGMNLYQFFYQNAGKVDNFMSEINADVTSENPKECKRVALRIIHEVTSLLCLILSEKPLVLSELATLMKSIGEEVAKLQSQAFAKYKNIFQPVHRIVQAALLKDSFLIRHYAQSANMTYEAALFKPRQKDKTEVVMNSSPLLKRPVL